MLPGRAVAELVGIEVGVVSGVIKTSNHPALKLGQQTTLENGRDQSY